MSSVSTRLRSGVLVALGSQFLVTGVQALLVPAFLAAWGAQAYGEWLTITAVVGWVALADLGFSTYVMNRLTGLRAKQRPDDYARTLHSALSFSVVASTAIFALFAGGLAWLPWTSWFEFSCMPSGAARTAAVLLTLQTAAAVPRGLLTGIYRTLGEYSRGVALANVERLGLMTATAFALLAGADPVYVAAAQLLPLTASVAYAFRDLRQRHPEVPLGFERRQPGLALQFLVPSLLFLLIQAGAVFVLQGSALLISSLVGAGALAVFVSLRTLANLVRQLGGALSNALWPELTMLAAKRRNADVCEVHRLAIKLQWCLALCAAAFLKVGGERIFAAWTGGRLIFDARLFDALLLHLIVQAPWRASSYALLASSRHAELARRELLAALLGLGAGALVIPTLGAAGLVLSLATAELALLGLYVPRRVCREFSDDWPAFSGDVLLRGSLTALGTMAAASALTRVGAAGLPVWLAALALSSVVPVLATWFFWLSASERGRVLQTLRPGRPSPQPQTQP